jgi:anti-sigma regulatory factor (Ser/Thr protein kinase)
MNTIEFPAAMENLDECVEFIINGTSKAGVDKKTLFQLRLACEEVVVNVINYAYPESQGNVRISYELNEETGELVIVISDSGIAFDPLSKDDPDLSLPMEERQIGGLGIFMVRTVMDTVEYSFEDGRNILTMRKNIKK